MLHLLMRTPRRDDALELGRAINARHTDARQMFLLLTSIGAQLTRAPSVNRVSKRKLCL